MFLDLAFDSDLLLRLKILEFVHLHKLNFGNFQLFQFFSGFATGKKIMYFFIKNQTVIKTISPVETKESILLKLV